MEEYTNMLRKLKIPIAQVISAIFLILDVDNINITININGDGMGSIWQKL